MERGLTGARPTIFVSHASGDKKAVDVLVDLLAGMGGGAADVFCTSSPGFDVPVGTGFFQYIQQLLRRSALIVHFITPAFLRSEFCMLEVGAAWAQGKSFPMLAPPLTLSDIKNGPLASLQMTTLVPGDGLDKLRDQVGDLVHLPVRAAGWSDRRDRAVRDISAALGEPSPASITRLAAVGVRDHHVEVWSLDAGGRVSHSWWPRDDGERLWNEPYDFPVPGGIIDLAAASRGPGHAEVFALDDRGLLWHRWWNPFNWSGWQVFHTRKVAPPIAACSLKDGHIEVFALDAATNTVIHRFSDEPGKWQDNWIPLDEGLRPK